MSVYEVATVGDNCIDRYGPPLGMSFVGGNAVNVAVHLAARRPGVAYFGAVGDDADGLRVVSALRERHVVVDNVRIRHTVVTAYTNVEFDSSGERFFDFEEFGACRGYRPSADDLAILKHCRHVHLGWLDDGGELKRALLSAGTGVSQDLSVSAAAVDVRADGLSIAFASADSPAQAGTMLAAIHAAGASVAVVTISRFGSLASDGRIIVTADAHPVLPVDTTGAGDTFIAAFIDARLAGHDLQSSLHAGSSAAVATCLHYGGFPQ